VDVPFPHLPPIDNFAVDHWKVSAEGTANERTNASEQKGSTSAGEDSASGAGTDGGSNAASDCGSGRHVGRVAVF